MTTDANNPHASPFRAWLEILRVPNLFTVPGDPIVGFLLASIGHPQIEFVRVIGPALASVFLYCAGLVSNDVFDLEEDRRDRPQRPIPSGRISRRVAVIAAICLFVLGLAAGFVSGVRTGYLACALTLLILLYNGGFKRIGLVGPLVMGLCRGFSLLLGASLFATWPQIPVVLVAASGLTLYIMSVTLVAAKETSGKAPGKKAMLPGALSFVWLWAMILALAGEWTARSAVGVLLALVAFAAWRTVVQTAEAIEKGSILTRVAKDKRALAAVALVVLGFATGMLGIAFIGTELRAASAVGLLVTLFAVVFWTWALADSILYGRGIVSATRTETVSQVIGMWLHNLLVMQACMAAMTGSVGRWVALALLAASWVSAFLHRRFYAS